MRIRIIHNSKNRRLVVRRRADHVENTRWDVKMFFDLTRSMSSCMEEWRRKIRDKRLIPENPDSQLDDSSNHVDPCDIKSNKLSIN